MKYLILILSSITIISCTKNTNPVSVKNSESAFGIYFLNDTSLTMQDISNIGIDKIDLNNEPWLSVQDIEYYDFSTHCIYLKKDKSYFFDNYDGLFFQFSPGLISRPFVVIADKERCYFGGLHSSLSSLAPTYPNIDELDVGFFPEDIIHISRAWSEDEDIRSDPKVAKALIKQNLFHSGLDIKLMSLHIIINSDTSTVEYSIKITNNDQDNLYVLDPVKIGSELFHYFTNGPELWNHNKSLYIHSQFKTIVSPDLFFSWNFDWFTLVKSNQSIIRIIKLKGYPYIPNGNYVAYMNFSHPEKIDKSTRRTSIGRIWIGSVRSNDLEIIL